jgi:hypothetical protein
MSRHTPRVAGDEEFITNGQVASSINRTVLRTFDIHAFSIRNQLAIMPASALIQSATLQRFLTAWKEKDVDGTIELWSEDFTQRLLPAALGVPTKSRSQAEMVYPSLMSSLKNWNVSNPLDRSHVTNLLTLRYSWRSTRSSTMLQRALLLFTQHQTPTHRWRTRSGPWSTPSSFPSPRMGPRSAEWRRC